MLVRRLSMLGHLPLMLRLQLNLVTLITLEWFCFGNYYDFLGINYRSFGLSVTIASAGGTITKGTGSSDLTINVGTSEELLPLMVVVPSDNRGTIATAGGFTFGGENMSTGGEYFSPIPSIHIGGYHF